MAATKHKCEVCNKTFYANKSAITCSDKCRKKRNRLNKLKGENDE